MFAELLGYHLIYEYSLGALIVFLHPHAHSENVPVIFKSFAEASHERLARRFVALRTPGRVL